MAIKSTKLQDEVRRKLNRINSEYGRTIDVSTMDAILTEAYHLYVENRLLVFELNSNVRNELRQLEIKNHPITPSIFKQDNKIYVAKYPKDYLKGTRLYVKSSKESCGEKELKGIIVQTDDLNEALRDPFYSPSFEFEEVLYDEGHDGIYIYTDGSFRVSSVIIDYIKRPNTIRTPSIAPGGYYIDSDGSKITSDVNLELDSAFQMRKIVDIAALIALRDLGDIQDYQAQLDKILRLESLHITQ